MDGVEPPATTVFDAVGGHPFFAALVDGFYRRVADDEVLRPMYHGDDLGPRTRPCGSPSTKQRWWKGA